MGREGATRWVEYEGPYPAVSVKNIPDIEELTLERGKPVELPAKVATDLAERKKVKIVSAPKSGKAEAPAADVRK